MSTASSETGVLLPNGCRITHGHGANVKKPFPDIMPGLNMHELTASSKTAFKGQLGYIEFDTDIRLPRHIHIDASKQKLTDELSWSCMTLVWSRSLARSLQLLLGH
ncbi:hypothetical protein LTS14_005294 [Recurvomyces mirabilis]|nr:hypothetical protein LTS14_005294 [Recurvomyces mirabilis]